MTSPRDTRKRRVELCAHCSLAARVQIVSFGCGSKWLTTQEQWQTFEINAVAEESQIGFSEEE
jgi:hypothetical protein